jgi:F-type H+-transporting ATPase subunit delta
MLARRYAKAIFDLGSAQGGLDKIGADLRTLAKAMKVSPELAQTLSSPAIKRSDRRKVLDALMQHIGVVSTTRNTVYLLLDGERLSSLPMISR